MALLVVGATGVVGREVCRLLREQGHDVRGLVRTSSDPSVVEALRANGVETAVGDLKSPESLRDACKGIEAVVSTATAISSQTDDSLTAVDRDGQLALIDAAVDAGVERFVYVSVLGLDDPSPFAAAKRQVEEHVRASGLTFTIVRPTVFMDTWLSPHVGFDWQSGAVTIYGDGTAPLAWVHSRDVAEVVAAATFDPAAADAEIAVLGPEALTPADVVGVFEAVTGRSFDVAHVTTDQLEAQRAGAEHPLEQSFAGLMLRYAAGDPPDALPTPGLPATHTTVEEYARQLISSTGSA